MPCNSTQLMGANIGGCTGRSLSLSDDSEDLIISAWRLNKGGDHMLLGIMDQNRYGKVLLCGAESARLVAALDPILLATGIITRGEDRYDRMWDVAWCGTRITSGSTKMSSASPWFPNGRVLVQILDAFCDRGWILVDGPNFGGLIDKDRAVSWPVFVFRRGTKVQNLFSGVKDKVLPGKLLVAGPEATIKSLQISLTEKLQSITPAVTCGPDAYDSNTWDAVWHYTEITTGASLLDLQSLYFLLGKTVLAILEEV